MKYLKIFNSKEIKVAAIGSLGIKFLSAFFAFLSSILLARLLGVNDFGIYIIAFTTVQLVSIPVSLGLPTLLTRYISKYEVSGNKSAIKGLLIRANQIVILATLLVGILAVLVYLALRYYLDPLLLETLWYSLLLLPLLALGSLRAAALRGLRFIVLGQLPDTLLRNFLLCVGIAVYYFSDNTLTPVLAMLLNVIAAGVAYGVGYVFLKVKLLNSLKHVKPNFHNREWFTQAIPFSINSGIQVIKSKLLTYVLALFGSFEAVAIFDIAMRGATLVAFTLDALNTAIAPYISNAFEKNNIESMQRIVTKTSRIIFAFAIPVVLIFILGGKELLVYLFGDVYQISYTPLVILCVGQLFNAVTGSVGLVLNMTDRQAYFTKVVGYVTLLSVFLSIPIVMIYDVIGAAMIYSVMLIVQNTILFLYVRKKLNINTSIF